MPLQIGQRLDHGFDEPLGLLSDCHRRIEHFLAALVVVDREAEGRALSEKERAALEASLKYFAEAAPRHTRDEEDSLFPRLRAAGDPAAARALDLIARLERDHEAADRDHAAVDAIVRRWLETNTLEPAAAEDLRVRLGRLQALYDRHIAVEDEELFPAASRLLTPTDIRQIGEEMSERRRG